MTKSEHKAANILEGKGWTILNRGWPDFLCVKEIGQNKVYAMAVEVKDNGDKVSPQQAACHQILRRMGIPVLIANPKAFEAPETGTRLLFEKDVEKYSTVIGRLQAEAKELADHIKRLSQNIENVEALFKSTHGEAKQMLANADRDWNMESQREAIELVPPLIGNDDRIDLIPKPENGNQ